MATADMNVSITLTVSKETAAVLLTAARAQRDALGKVLTEAKDSVTQAQAAYDAAIEQVKHIENVSGIGRQLVGTREYASDSRYGVKHTVSKYRSVSGLDEYECSCESFRFCPSVDKPKYCKHTSRARFDWFMFR